MESTLVTQLEAQGG